MSDINIDGASMSDSNTDNATTGHKNMDNTAIGETSTVRVPLPPDYGGKAKDPSQIKTSTKCMPTMAEPSIGDPPPNEVATHLIQLMCIYMNS